MNQILIYCLVAMVLNALCSTIVPTPNLMELSARPWIYELNQKYGNINCLDDIPDEEIDYYKGLGITDIYLLGVWSIGDYGLKHDRTDTGLLQSFAQVLPDFTEDDIIGSPFAITTYTVNPQIGDENQLLNFRNRLHQRNMRLVLDFVPNHTAIDSPFVSRTRDIYVQAPAGHENEDKYIPGKKIAYGRDLYGYIWTDTAQLNYWEPNTWTMRIRDLLTVAKFADGIRCDMAMLALNRIHYAIWKDELSASGYTQPPHNGAEFWQYAIDYVRSHVDHDIFFMAEMYWNTASELIQLGFDYVYNKEGLYDALSPPLSDKAASVRNWFNNIGDDIYHQASFVSNHDEEPGAQHWGRYRSDHPALANGAVPLTIFTVPGLKFHWMGEWEGFTHKLDIHLRRRSSESVDISISTMYDALLSNVLTSKTLTEGTYLGLENNVIGDTDKVLAWSYKHEQNNMCLTVVVNLSDHNRAGLEVKFRNVENTQGGVFKYTDIMTEKVYQESMDDLAKNNYFSWIILDEWQAQVFEYTC